MFALGQYYDLYTYFKRSTSKIEELQNLFDINVPQAYIADGHHRTSTAALLYDKMKGETGEKYRNFFTTFFSFEELEIFDFNRIVYGLNDLEPEVFMAKLSEIFEIKILKKPVKPSKKFEIVMLFNKNWYRLQWKKRVLKENEFTSKEQLVGNLLQNQQDYGFGDIQYYHKLDKMNKLFTSFNPVKLSKKGRQTLYNQMNFYAQIRSDFSYLGGTKKYNYLYVNNTGKLLKITS